MLYCRVSRSSVARRAVCEYVNNAIMSVFRAGYDNDGFYFAVLVGSH